MKQVVKNITILIPDTDLLRFFVEAITSDARAAEGQEQTHYKALSHLVGITDIQAVALANQDARDCARETVTSEEFRKWLPGVFSAFAAKVLLEEEGQ